MQLTASTPTVARVMLAAMDFMSIPDMLTDEQNAEIATFIRERTAPNKLREAALYLLEVASDEDSQ